MSRDDSNEHCAVSSFLGRHGLPMASRDLYWDFVKAHFPREYVQESPCQGFCSLTLCVGSDIVVQFRPPIHALDLQLLEYASRVYGAFAPHAKLLDTIRLDTTTNTSSNTSLLVYSIRRLPGISLAELHLSADRDLQPSLTQREILVRDFAHFLSLSWPAAHPSMPFRRGLVGNSLHCRLDAMHARLPPRFRPTVQRVIAALPRIEALPWAMTHGDIVPGNIMLAMPTLRLAGLVDWAEAEWLPFGVGIHGAEEFFGETVGGSWATTTCYPPPGSRFVYYGEEKTLRAAFWNEIERRIPELETDADLKQTVRMARLLGVLLWHGIAFDGGSLDRVVQDGRDGEEIQRLDLFLFADEKYLDTSIRVASPSCPEADNDVTERQRRRRRLSWSDMHGPI